jgi:hypothetical protein
VDDAYPHGAVRQAEVPEESNHTKYAAGSLKRAEVFAGEGRPPPDPDHGARAVGRMATVNPAGTLLAARSPWEVVREGSFEH